MQHDGFLRTKVFLCVGGNDIMLQALYLSLDETTTGHSAYISRYHNTIVFHYMLFVYIRVYIVLCYIFFLERYLRYFLYNSGRPNFLLKIFYPFFPFYRITRMNHKRYRIIYSLRLKNRTYYSWFHSTIFLDLWAYMLSCEVIKAKYDADLFSNCLCRFNYLLASGSATAP